MSSDTETAPPSVPRPFRPGPSRRAILLTLLVIAVVVAAIAVVPVAFSLPWAPLFHYECAPGVQVASESLWTPEVLVNSPYGGFGNGTGNSFGTRVMNGSSAGIFELDRWNISTSVRVVVAGPGANAACAGYLARRDFGGGYASSWVGPRNVTSDVGQTMTFMNLAQGSVLFYNGFVETDRTVSTCGSGPFVWEVSATSMAVDVPFPRAGGTELVSVTLQGAYNYTYSFPGHFGTWAVDDLNAGSHAPGGGYAFQFTPCA